MLGLQSETSRRQFLKFTRAVAASAAFSSMPTIEQLRSPAIKAVAFDAFAIFDLSPVYRLLEEVFPGRGAELSSLWRAKQFEYTWLRNSMGRYADFWQVTQSALTHAAEQSRIDLNVKNRMRLMSAHLLLKPWPEVIDVVHALETLNLRLALLTNWTNAMMECCLHGSGLEDAFHVRLSTGRVKAFKPDPAAYCMALDTLHLRKDEIVFVAFGGWNAAGAKAFGFSNVLGEQARFRPRRAGCIRGRDLT